MKIALIIVVLCSAFNAFAVSAACFKNEVAFTTGQAKGWVVDNDGARKFNMCTVYVLEGFNAESSPAIFYPKIFDLPAGPGLSVKARLEKFIEADIAKMKAAKPDLQVNVYGDFKNFKGINFSVRHILNGPKPNEFQTIAYGIVQNSIYMATLSARNKTDFDKHLVALTDFLNTMQTMSRADLYKYAKNKAEETAKTEVGNYFRGEFIKSIGNIFSDSLKTCVNKTDKGFKAVILVDKKGFVQDWFNEKDSNVSICMQNKIRYLTGAPPPETPFYILLTLKLK